MDASTAGEAATYGVNSAWLSAAACRLRGATAGARLWCWVLRRDAAQDASAADGVHFHVRAAHELELPSQEQILIRCDRVDFPLGGVAYTHVHSGPGMRCLLQGELRVEIEDEEILVRPGEFWFERGTDPVLARASETELTSFVRTMVLPVSFKGRSSIRYIRQEDADKPKLQEYTRFVDEIVSV